MPGAFFAFYGVTYASDKPCSGNGTLNVTEQKRIDQPPHSPPSPPPLLLLPAE
jgi:hypothetical protein